MNVKINGHERELPDGSKVMDAVTVVADDASASKGIAVAVNGEVVARSRWEEVDLNEEDRVEILRAVGGG